MSSKPLYLAWPAVLGWALWLSGLLAPTLTQGQAMPGAGNSLVFDGLPTLVNAGSDDRGIDSTLTVELWVRTTASGDYVLVEKGRDGRQPLGFRLVMLNGRVELRSTEDEQGQFLRSGFAAAVVNDGQWHHVAGVSWGGNRWGVYVDGFTEGASHYPSRRALGPSTEPLLIGGSLGRSQQLWNRFSGEIDELRIWNTVRNTPQLRAGMCRKMSPVPASLLSYYRFDHDGGTTVRDDGSRPSPGTLYGPWTNPWQRSGAPLGDVSLAWYDSVEGPLHLRLASARGDTAQLYVPRRAALDTLAAQLYVVNSPPNPAPTPGTTSSYAGVFVLERPQRFQSPRAAVSFDFILRPAGSLQCQDLWWRNSGAVSFRPVAYSRTATTLRVAAQLYRGEYAAVADPSRAPVPRFSLGPDTLLCQGQRLLLHAPTGAGLRYEWSDGSTGPSLAVTEAGTYSLRVRSDCDEASASITVQTRPCLEIPNIVTPNGDGLNDALAFRGLVGPGWQLRVFNRWGRQVFASNSYANDWRPPDSLELCYILLQQPSSGFSVKGWVEVRP